jgi:hypothetical protein
MSELRTSGKEIMIEKIGRAGWVCRFFFVFLFIGIPSMVQADLGNILSKFTPSISVWEQYSDNLDLVPKNKSNDFITTVYPGLKFSANETKYGMDLDYHLGLIFYAKNTDRNYISHDGTMNAWYTFGRNLTFRVREYLVRSEEPREQEFIPGALPGQYLLGTQRARAIYIRNVFEPSIDYRFGRDNHILFNYQSNIYNNQNPLFQDSREDFLNPKFIYWFDIRNGISLEYGLTFGDFSRSSNLTGHMGTGRYTYRFNPRTSIFGEYTFLRRDFRFLTEDYDVHRPSFGISHEFSPTLSGKVQLGYFWQVPTKASTTGGIYYDASLSQRTKRTTYTILFQGGYNEDYFTAENLGFSKYHRVIGTISHQLRERMTVALSGSFERAKYGQGERDNIWGVTGDASYRVFKWLTVSLEASHRQNLSNIEGREYKENRGLFKVTGSL